MVDKSRSRSRNGAGLGLALCAEILALHESRLEIDSTLGEGTCMSFLIHAGRKEDGDEKTVINYLLLLVAALVAVFSVWGPEALAVYKDKTILNAINTQTTEEGEKGYRYQLTAGNGFIFYPSV